jgi:predicted  nucleic acid-binding Zn-ribbon protein
MNDGHEPATKADIGALKADIDAVREQIHDSETKLLTAFYDFARANQHRVSELEHSDANLTRRIGGIEDRLLEVEKRLNIPPAA